MAEITAQLVKQLRDKTNASMMKCKEALVESAGDLEQAETILRKRGIEGAGKKASRTAREGVVAAHIVSQGRTGALIEVNCETDFVAKNERFQRFVADLAAQAAGSSATGIEALLTESSDSQPGSTVESVVKSAIAELGENIVLRRLTRFQIETGRHGVVASYIHLHGKVGVLLEVGCEKPETVTNETFRTFVSDVTLHITAAHPACLSRDEVPETLVEKEKEIYREQVTGKPDNIVEKIVQGKLEKFYSTICLLEQGFIKDPDRTVGELLKATSQAAGDALSIRRFVRFAVGEDA
ncbi:MAG TPA: translation elongation factor Ts [Verrucomicrobiales bacterium]|nr:translation elongation factor Ts [Verrucomicrobiales bacterium]